MFKKEKYIMKLLVSIFFLSAVFLSISDMCLAAEEKDPNNIGEKMAKLKSMLGETPTIASQEAISLQTEIAKTKRLDAAILLIESLSLSIAKPQNMDETIQNELIPAIELLEKNFGQDIAPLLYTKAISTKDDWLRARIALAARTILPKETIAKMNQIFSLDKSTESSAIEYLEMLNRSILIIDLPSSVSPQEQEILDKLKNALKEKIESEK